MQLELDHVDRLYTPFALDSLTELPVRSPLYLLSDIKNTALTALQYAENDNMVNPLKPTVAIWVQL